jgi:hypothetical protein
MPWFRDLWRWLVKDPVDEASERKLRLEVDGLETRFRTVDEQTLAIDSQKAIYAEVSALFAARRTTKKELEWEERYLVESRIGYLLSGDRLRQEVASRLRWAKTHQVPQANELENAYSSLLKSPNTSGLTDEVLRDFLLEVLDASVCCLTCDSCIPYTSKCSNRQCEVGTGVSAAGLYEPSSNFWNGPFLAAF